MKNQDFFCEICIISGISPGPPGPPHWLRLWFWDKIAPISFFIKRKIQSKIKITFFPKRGGLESSHLTVFLKRTRIAWHYYDVDTWSSLLLLTFVCVNPKLKKLQFQTKDNVLAMLSLYLSLVVFHWRGLLYRLCYSINFVITLDEGLGLQPVGKNSYISYSFCI